MFLIDFSSQLCNTQKASISNPWETVSVPSEILCIHLCNRKDHKTQKLHIFYYNLKSSLMQVTKCSSFYTLEKREAKSSGSQRVKHQNKEENSGPLTSSLLFKLLNITALLLNHEIGKKKTISGRKQGRVISYPLIQAEPTFFSLYKVSKAEFTNKMFSGLRSV